MGLVLFDFDGTLADTHKIVEMATQDTFSELGCPVPTVEQMAAWRGMPVIARFREFLGNAAETARLAEVVRLYDENYQKYELLLLEPYDLARESLEEIKGRNHALGVISSKASSALKRNLQQIGLLDLMDVVLGSDDVDFYKPHPEGILKAWEQVPAEKDQTIMVGDTIYDMQMGKKAGVHTVGITWGGSSAEKLQQEKPAKIVSTFIELEMHIMNILENK